MSNNWESQSSSQPQLGTAYYIFDVEPRSKSQSSSQQQLGTGNYMVRVEPRNASKTSFVMNISQEIENSETRELPEKQKPIEFDKTVDLMLGIEENSL